MAEASVDFAPNQSETTTPSKPQSPRSNSSSSQACSEAWVPLTRL